MSSPAPRAGGTDERFATKELNAKVAEHVMGWTIAHYICGERHVGFHDRTANYYETPEGRDVDDVKRSDIASDRSHWSPSTDIAAAWLVVERMLDLEYEPEFRHDVGPTGAWWVADFGHSYKDAGYAIAETLPRAICIAALYAVGAQHA